MKVNRIVLKDFRGYSSLDVSFSPKVNFIYGDNGQGKTNLIEAIYYLNLARSYRCKENTNLIKEGASIAKIEAFVETKEIEKKIDIEIDEASRKIFVNENQVRKLSEFSSYLNIILFVPNDVNLFYSSPSTRRDFLDMSIGKSNPRYIRILSEYKEYLKQRNLLLKEENLDLSLLDVYDENLISLGKQIDEHRFAYIQKINGVLPEICQKLRKDYSSMFIEYKPLFLDKSHDELKLKFINSREYDLLHKQTSLGVQKEDFKMIFNGKDISIFGSQGENRLAALALKLTPYFLIEDEEEKPIVILDDISSELDKNHQENLFKLFSELSQVFITSVHKEECPQALYLKVCSHKLVSEEKTNE